MYFNAAPAFNLTVFKKLLAVLEIEILYSILYGQLTKTCQKQINKKLNLKNTILLHFT